MGKVGVTKSGNDWVSMSVLREIFSKKRERVNVAKSSVSLASLREAASAIRVTSESHRLKSALQTGSINVIAEYKRRSPSKGVIRSDVDVQTMVKMYEAGGAAAISVLTEEDYFAGSLDDLRTVKSTVSIPVLRKDFVFDEYQLFESAAAGADAVLLIVAMLEDQTLLGLRRIAEDELGMDALVEVHNSNEMHRAIDAGASLIGVNNRNLHTFEVSLRTSFELARLAPMSATMVSESGLRDSEDLKRLSEVGYRGFLIGETLMRAENPVEVLRNYAAQGVA